MPMKKGLQIILLIISISSYGQNTALQFDKDLKAYYGIDNPITVLAENVDCDSMIVFANSGIIKRDSINQCKFLYKPISSIDTIIIARIEMNNDTILIDKKRVGNKILPLYGSFFGKTDGKTIKKDLLMNFPKTFEVTVLNMDINLKFPVDSFTVKIKRKCDVTYKKRYSINDNFDELKNEFSKLKSCEEIEFLGIRYEYENNILFVDTRMRLSIE